MRKILGLFLAGFFIFQFIRAEARTGLSDKAGYNAEDKAADLNAWDFGKAKQDQVLKHDFIFKNDTAAVLNILSVNTSCGCTASQADKKSLKPGESTTISVTFNSKKYVGEVKQSVYVNTDNADLPIVKFIIKAEVLKGGY